MLFGILVAVVASASWGVAHKQGVERLRSLVHDRLTVNLHAVESEIERFRYLPDVISKDPRIIELLVATDGAGIGIANGYLQSVRSMSGADELYVIDLSGETLAASNWNEEGSFVGHNYGFRPYFTDAISTGSGRFYAVGVTTGRPGYFLSSRVVYEDRTIGVVVAKVDIGPLARTWAEAGEVTAIADREGIIFLSGEPRWTYRPLHKLSAETLNLLDAERRYDGIDLARAEPLAPSPGDGSADRTIGLGNERYLMGVRGLEPDGWLLLSALPLGPVETEARLVGASSALLALLTLAVGLFLRQRQQLTRMKLEQNAVLEGRVAERTAALAHEVEERKRAEQDLRTMQDSLIHAAKLAALGRMSAAIVHEVSQPLSALDNTLAAAGLHAERDAKAEVQRNLTSARSLLKRMQRTVKHLRTFSSRRDATPPEPIDANQAIEAAMDIVEPRARENGVAIAYERRAGLPPVTGNSIRLEQVLINLLLNAVDASVAAGQNRIVVVAEVLDAALRITVSDMGQGITPEVQQRLFEPFFTTKTTGEGLGLGLSISKTIIEEFGGKLNLVPLDAGGTQAWVELPLHVEKQRQLVSA
ncbi:ATP-binding protein [Devosia sp. SD17-2]|uniref:ATP-binding protein n=1 Tax=Devosia sp. SD17-2 TaxID=2976459 RepID=UPI0023D7BECE|nr:ATP-binding protein [Devosia sp. SD17-2]WEJ34992.1 ATP-binding protein [Devosia sp. SD17-2]